MSNRYNKSTRLVESFEEFVGKTGSRDYDTSLSKKSSVSTLSDLGRRILNSLEDINITQTIYSDYDLRFEFEDGSYLYFIFRLPLNDVTDVRSSILSMFNSKGGGLADEFMGDIRRLMANGGNYPYSIIEEVISHYGKEIVPHYGKNLHNV